MFVASKSIKDGVGEFCDLCQRCDMMTLFANHFYGYPSESLYDWSTGANGKTTVACIWWTIIKWKTNRADCDVS